MLNESIESRTRAKYRELTLFLIEHKLTITAMESCTSGLIASLITDTEGSSAIFRGSAVTYSNEAKIAQGVPAEIIKKYGVYSIETSSAMAEAIISTYPSDISIGITGTTGNLDPENNDSVPGEVYYTINYNKKTRSLKVIIPPQDTRYNYKLYAALEVVNTLLSLLKE